MLRVGLTGGIGSGKTTVAGIFERLHIPVFYADDQSKAILNEDEALKQELTEHFGDHIYKNGILVREVLAKIVFNNTKKLELLNSLVHPAVAKRFDDWCQEQNSTYILKEAAILFETGSYRSLDKNILVTAPVELRMQRVMKRNNVNEEDVRSRMSKQWTDEQKAPLSDFIIVNDEKESLIKQILAIHESIIHPSD